MKPVLVTIVTLMLAGCGGTENANILEIVKAGKLESTNKPIGKAFDDAFPGGTWNAATTGMGIGEMVAEFDSTATAEALEARGFPPIDRKHCRDGVKKPCRVPVSFQFTLAPNFHTITLAEVKAPEPMKSGEELDVLLAIVYR